MLKTVEGYSNRSWDVLEWFMPLHLEAVRLFKSDGAVCWLACVNSFIGFNRVFRSIPCRERSTAINLIS